MKINTSIRTLKGRFRGKVYRYLNGICPIVVEAYDPTKGETPPWEEGGE